MDVTNTETRATEIAAATTAVTDALWHFGAPSGYTMDPDSQKLVAWSTHSAIVALATLVADDEAAMTQAAATIRAFVAARSTDEYDRGQADRLARALRRGWLCARISRHPGARRFATLIAAVSSGRATGAQMRLAATLAAEV